MAIPRIIKTLEEVAEPLRDLYKEQSDGTFSLDVQGEDPKLSEFRNNNRALHNQMKELEKAMEPFKGLDPKFIEHARQAAEAAKTAEEKELLQKGDFQEIIRRRTAGIVEDSAKRVAEIQKGAQADREAAAQLRARLGQLTIDQDIQKAISAAGVKPLPGALPDILARTHRTFRINDEGGVEPVDEKGEARYGSDGNPITMKEYVEKDLVASAPHLFEGGGGGGGSGGKGQPPRGRIIDSTDALEFGKNLEDIASGKAKVK